MSELGDRISEMESAVARLADHRFKRTSTDRPPGFEPPPPAPAPDVVPETDAPSD